MDRIQTGARALAACVAAVMLGVGGCYQTYLDLGDGDHGVDVATDSEADAVEEADTIIDADTDVGEFADTAAETDGASCPGWYDPASGLCWQNPPDGTPLNWVDAVSYCDGLAWGGRDDWRLSSISELRSLIRGCAGTVTGGTCGVTDTCRGGGPCWDDSCDGCPLRDGPGTDGTYWPPEFGSALGWYWSSSSHARSVGQAFVVGFFLGNIFHLDKRNHYFVLCVRPGPGGAGALPT